MIITAEIIEKLELSKSTDPIVIKFASTLYNRRKLDNYYAICKAVGFDKFVEVCSPSGINKAIIKELNS